MRGKFSRYQKKGLDALRALRSDECSPRVPDRTTQRPTTRTTNPA
jgi:hypothetical protein